MAEAETVNIDSITKNAIIVKSNFLCCIMPPRDSCIKRVVFSLIITTAARNYSERLTVYIGFFLFRDLFTEDMDRKCDLASRRRFGRMEHAER